MAALKRAFQTGKLVFPGRPSSGSRSAPRNPASESNRSGLRAQPASSPSDRSLQDGPRDEAGEFHLQADSHCKRTSYRRRTLGWQPQRPDRRAAPIFVRTTGRPSRSGYPISAEMLVSALWRVPFRSGACLVPHFENAFGQESKESAKSGLRTWCDPCGARLDLLSERSLRYATRHSASPAGALSLLRSGLMASSSAETSSRVTS
jgi:hypothetical protein